jgi:hypothetical protein
MSRPKDPMRYPAFCYQTIRLLNQTPSKPLEFPCRDKAAAHNFRVTFNCFKKAALDAGWDDKFPTLANMIVRISEVPGGTWVAQVIHIDYDSDVSIWNKAVGLDPVPDEVPRAYADRDPDSKI